MSLFIFLITVSPTGAAGLQGQVGEQQVSKGRDTRFIHCWASDAQQHLAHGGCPINISLSELGNEFSLKCSIMSSA